MSKQMKHLLSVALALVIVLSLTVHVAAEGEESLNLPKANVKNLLTEDLTPEEAAVMENAPELSFALQFSANKEADENDEAWPKEEWLTTYGNWPADFVLTVNDTVTFDTDEDSDPDGYLAGEYGDWGWIAVPSFGLDPVTLDKDNPSVKIMAYAAEKLNQPGLAKITYAEVCGSVGVFNCGVYFEPEYLESHPDFKVELSLRLYNPEPDTNNLPDYYDICTFSFSAEELFVASVGEKKFMTLENAIAAVEGSGTVTLLQNYTQSEKLVVDSGKKITLDLNENTLYMPSGNHEIVNEAELTITNGNLVLDNAVTSANALFNISGYNDVFAKLTLDNVAVNAKEYSSAYGVFYAYDVGAVEVKNSVLVFENDGFDAGGVFKADADTAVFTVADSTLSFNNAVRGFTNGTVTISGSAVTITGESTEATLDNGINSVKMTVTDSTITIDGCYDRALTLDSENVTVTNSTLNLGSGSASLRFKAGAGKLILGEGAVINLENADGALIKLDTATEVPADRIIGTESTQLMIGEAANNKQQLHTHNSDKEIPAVDATCTEPGLTAGKACSVCDKVMQSQNELPVLVHNWTRDFVAGTDTHWFACQNQGCDAKDAEAAHKFERLQNSDTFVAESDCAIQYNTICRACQQENEADTYWVAKETPVHKYDEGKVTTKPNCTTAGVKTFTCQNAGCSHTKTEEVEALDHSEVDLPAKEATCTEPGLTAGKKCSTCGITTVAQTVVAAKGHTAVDLPAKAATCTEPGLTAGKKCSVCDAVIKAQETVAAKGHTEVDLAAKEATCTEPGLTAGKKCSVCDAVIKAQETVAAKGHTAVDLPAKAVTCTEPGLTAGKMCSVCDAVIKAQETVAAKGHTAVDLPAKAATCTEPGLTAGKKCSVCGTVTVAQTEVAAAGHKLAKVDAVAATYFASGNIEHYTCDNCDAIFADEKGEKALTAAEITVPQLVKIEDAKAEVSTEVVEDVVKEAVAAGNTSVVITVTEDKLADEKEEEDDTESGSPEVPAPAPVVTTTQLPVAAVEQVAELHEEATLTINMTNATVTMDKTTLDVVSEKAKTAETDVVTLQVEHIETEELAPEQQAAVEDKKVAAVISASILVNDEEVHNFEGGKVTVAIPFQLEEGTKGTDYAVFYIADDGSVEEIPATYANGTLVMTLSHFSEYVVVNRSAPKDPSNPGTGDSFQPAAMVMLMITAAALVVLAEKKRYAK